MRCPAKNLREMMRCPMKDFRMMYWSRSWMMVLFGATVGAVLDWMHTHGEEILYPEGANHYRGILTFAFVYWFGAALFTWWNVITKNPKRPQPHGKTLPQVGIYCLLYAFTAYGDIHSWWIAAVLVAVSLVHWQLLEGGTWQGLTGGIIAAICGAGVEGLLSHWGTMSYVVQDYAYVPIWLPPIYFACAMTWGQTTRRLLTVKDHAAPN